MMQEHEIICLVCPLACRIKLTVDREKIIKMSGNKCSKGKDYAIQEVIAPERILTTTVRTSYPERPLLSVRTDRPIPKKLLFECMGLLADIKISSPLKFGEVLINNILDTKANIVATQDLVESIPERAR